jgi:hypothetical protein
MRSRLVLLLWLVGILFPMAWLGRFSPTYRRAFDAIFAPAWMHWFTHALLFGVLAALFVIVLRINLDRKTTWIGFALVLGVGFFQETFQVLSGGSFSLAGSVIDLGVDLMGGLLGLGVVYVFLTLENKNLRQPGGKH